MSIQQRDCSDIRRTLFQEKTEEHIIKTRRIALGVRLVHINCVLATDSRVNLEFYRFLMSSPKRLKFYSFRLKDRKIFPLRR